MAVTRISDNQIADTTSAIITTLSFLNADSVFKIPTGDTNDRPTGSISLGTMRFNTDEDLIEIYVADSDNQGNAGWKAVDKGAGGLGTYSFIRGNPRIITEDLEIPDPAVDPTYQNAFTKGPIITIDTGYSVIVPSGVVWSIF